MRAKSERSGAVEQSSCEVGKSPNPLPESETSLEKEKEIVPLNMRKETAIIFLGRTVSGGIFSVFAAVSLVSATLTLLSTAKHVVGHLTFVR
jgi:hypothetical protein